MSRRAGAQLMPFGANLLRGHQPIADARLVEDQTRLIGVGFDFLTQLSDQHPKILQREALIVRPDPLQQEVVGHDEPEMGRQNMEQVVFVLGQRTSMWSSSTLRLTRSTLRGPAKTIGFLVP